VRSTLFQINGSEKKPLQLPEPEGPVTSKSDKIYVPVDKYPDYNFVGRILGPRGMTAKQLEHETGCKIMVRGKGSMRDRKKEEQMRGKPNWEHLNEPLHVLITCEDTQERAQVKLLRAKEEVEKLLVPVADGEDELKKKQLIELAIINGTYRDSASKSGLDGGETLKLMPTPIITRHHGLGAPVIIGPQLQHLLPQHVLNGNPAGHPTIMTSHDATAALLYSRAYDFGTQYAHNLLGPHLMDFQTTQTTDGLSATTGKLLRRSILTTNVRDHPYQRPAKTT